MIDIEVISNRIADKIAEEIKADNEKKEVIAYGIFGIIQTLLSILLVVIFGIIFNVLIEGLMMSFSTGILRKYSGGVHASNSKTCMIIGTFNCTIVPIVIKYLPLTLKMIIITGIFTFILAYFLIFKLAPVDSIKKPIKSIKKKKILKKKSIVVLTFYLTLVCIFIFNYYNLLNKNMLIYCICIYAGIMWQVFSITKVGYIVLGKIDSFFNKFI
ncbi:accessory gene regulator B [Clostridium moniliforme]|uniref:Accessory gene regulator B n=1 Tax=Clostridium moniliforme TaxID=39489 RepID=A0ABS4EXI9_9CLOT|nr:accessory gene regulator B family protein [Clostridium moniliforme]MBP1888712.1 accessory gene regulator B [Clostridium moniliforme]